MHGRPRNQTLDEKKALILKEKIQVFSSLRKNILQNKKEENYAQELLANIETALCISPEFYSLWNYRKEIITHLIESAPEKIKEVYENELKLTATILSKHHMKSYGTWHHRSWIMLKLDKSYWETDLDLTSQLLKYDNRNFHCWNYRRFILHLLERKPSSELEYLYSMLDDVQNYSAWHNRSSLLVEYSEKEDIPLSEVINQEYDLCTNAFYTEPSNQSAWIYHRWLLSTSEGKQLKSKDLETCKDLLEMMTDLKNPLDEKWCLVTIVLNMLDEHKLEESEKQTVLTHLEKLIQIDPTHKGYYNDIRSDFLLKHTNKDDAEKLIIPSMNISRINILNTIPNLCDNLKVVDLSNNDILFIPQLKLKNLETLILDNNKIRFLEGLSELTKLNMLSIKNNQVKRIPSGLISNTVTMVNLDENPLPYEEEEFNTKICVAFPNLSLWTK